MQILQVGVLGRQALLVGVYLLLADGVQHGVHRLGNLVDLLDAGVLWHPDFRVPVLDGADGLGQAAHRLQQAAVEDKPAQGDGRQQHQGDDKQQNLDGAQLLPKALGRAGVLDEPHIPGEGQGGELIALPVLGAQEPLAPLGAGGGEFLPAKGGWGIVGGAIQLGEVDVLVLPQAHAVQRGGVYHGGDNRVTVYIYKELHGPVGELHLGPHGNRLVGKGGRLHHVPQVADIP